MPFSENFTEDDLSRMGEMISDSDEEPFLAPRISPLHSTNTNGDSPASSELHVPASHILQSSLQACGGGSSNDTGKNDIAFSSSPRFCEKTVNLAQKTQEKHPEPVESKQIPLFTINISGTVQGNLPEYSFYDPTLAANMPESPLLLQSPSSINMSSSLCESPNYVHIIAQQIDQLGCTESPAPTPVTLPVVSPDDHLGCAESTAPTPATLPVGLPDEQLLGCPASPASTPTLLPIGSPGMSGNYSDQLKINDSEPAKKKRRYTNKKDKGRLRLVHKHEWLDVKRKDNRNSGKPYTGRDGKLRKKRELPACGDKCIFKCSQKINDFERDLQFVAFWSLGELVRHWDFINRYCDKIPKRRFTCEAPTRRESTIRYYLPTGVGTENLPRTEEPKIRVCKTMFLNTLGIKQGMVYSALNKLSIQGTVLKDNRGRHPNHKKVITEEMITSVCDHVNSFIPVESHYVRERTSKLYLDGTLSFARMFLLYQEWSDPKNNTKVMTARQYTDIVNEKINLGFHVPKKDQCDVCHVFKNLPRPVTEEQMRNYMTHIRNKTIARELKNKDKENSGKRSEVLSAVYDFQKVHGMPCAETSILYYKRKLTVFNFTIFEMGSRVAKCYVWDESTAKRGAIEVSSCINDFIREHHQKGIKIFNFWSDNCGGQNRNRIVFASYLRAAKDFQVTITHKYFEKGHTQNEGDSVHALIERTAKNKMVYTPDQWFALIRWAKQDGNPYIVKEMGTSDFFDFKTLLSGCNWKMNTDRERVFWSQIRQLEILPDESNKIDYKTNFCDHEFKTIIVQNTLETPRTRRIRNRRENNLLLAPLSRPLIQAYMGKLPIPQAKLQDLKYLCQTNIIPSIYHEFYNNLIEGCVRDVDERSEEDEEE